MKFAVQVNSSPYGGGGSDSAYQFIRAALRAGHEVLRVFFYHDGVYHGLSEARAPSDEHQVVGRWMSLAVDTGLDLVICISAAQRRGVVGSECDLDESQPGHLPVGFRIGGTGLWVDACLKSDRFLVFG